MNKDLLKPISEVKPKYALTQKQLLIQNRTEKSILYAMDEDTYEELVTSWAYLCLDGQYDQTYRIGGTGDHGIDVLAVIAGQPNRYHIYQCKHYSESLKPSTVYPEVCKILYHIFKGSIPTPEKYFIIAPKDLTPQLIEDYTDKSKLRNTIQSNWHKYSKNIVNGIIIHLDHELSSFIDSFDFEVFQYISTDSFLSKLRENKSLYIQYFGLRKDLIERISLPTPDEIQRGETNYIRHLLDAYNDADTIKSVDTKNVVQSRFASHFSRARDCYWIAESLRKMSEENSPGDTDEFGELKKDMYLHVSDIYEEDYSNALLRNKEVIKEAKNFLPKSDRIISGEIGPGEKMGLCYHLSNDNKLIWKK